MEESSKPNSNHSVGLRGEGFVECWLQEQGFTILEKNFRTRYGEIDLIACKKEILVFVEVKTRSQPIPLIADLVPFGKQKKIIRTAQKYLAHHAHDDKVWRFDVAYVHNEKVHYIPNAFTKEPW
jgi:putative endonuclease